MVCHVTLLCHVMYQVMMYTPVFMMLEAASAHVPDIPATEAGSPLPAPPRDLSRPPAPANGGRISSRCRQCWPMKRLLRWPHHHQTSYHHYHQDEQWREGVRNQITKLHVCKLSLINWTSYLLCTFLICFVRLCCFENWKSHLLQAYLTPSWIFSTCCLRLSFCVNCLSHWLQSNLTALWMFSICLIRVTFCANSLLHSSQRNLTPLCILWACLYRLA